MSKSQSLLSWLGSRVLLSFLSALAGWTTGMMFFTIPSLAAVMFRSKEQLNIDTGGYGLTYQLESLLIIAYVMGIVILTTWILVLVPLTLFVPCRFSFWKPGVLTSVGSITGPILILILAAYDGLSAGVPITERLAPNIAGLLFFGIPTIIVGATTGYVAALLNKRSL